MVFRTVLVGILAIFVGLYFNEIGTFLKQCETSIRNSSLFKAKETKVWLDEHLEKYKHVVIFGHVYDVSSAPRFYGKDGHYNFFTGGDMTRAFANSDLSGKSFVSTVEGLPANFIQNAFDWLREFQGKYPFVGYLQGLYFDSKGRPTTYYENVKESVKVYAETKKKEEEMFPFCNVFSNGTHSEVDCIKGMDDGKYPRLFSSSTQRDPRCACIPQNFLNTGRAHLYPGCSEFDQKCAFDNNELEKLLEKFTGTDKA